jgi:hypothetical protein
VDKGIQADEFVFKEINPLPQIDLNAAAIKELEKQQLIELPGTVFIGIIQSRMAGGADA